MDKSFTSCANGKDLSTNLWRNDEPNNVEFEETCAGVSLKNNYAAFDVSCVTKFRVICEVWRMDLDK
jgi:hypothetical protein